MEEPALRAWMQESVRADSRPGRRPPRPLGRRARVAARAAARRGRSRSAPGALGDERAAAGASVSIAGTLECGIDAGDWLGFGRRVDVPLEQRAEDGRSLVFDTQPLGETVEILGIPRAQLAVSADRPQALLAVRLCDVAPDGTSTLVTRGVLNLTHRDEPRDARAARARRDGRSHASSSTRSRTPSRPATASGSPSRRPTGRGRGRRPPPRS